MLLSSLSQCVSFNVCAFWRILVFLGFGAFLLYGFKTGAFTNSWTSFLSLGFLSLGLALNLMVIILNKGFMPVRAETIPRDYQTSHKPMDSQTCAQCLGDWIPFVRGYCSPGDVCLVVALVIGIIDWVLRNV